VQQVAGLSQIAGELMLVNPSVIDLGWGKLKSALVNLRDAGFVAPPDAAAHRRMLVDQYVSAFRHVEAGALGGARSTLKDLAAIVASRVVSDQHDGLQKLIDGQLAKLA
jgi:hypothetical protein